MKLDEICIKRKARWDSQPENSKEEVQAATVLCFSAGFIHSFYLKGDIWILPPLNTQNELQ